MTTEKPRHTRNGPILVRFADGPMADHHMTVNADGQGQPPTIVRVAHQPERPVDFSDWRTAPTISTAPQVLTYHLARTLATVPWSYEYTIQPNSTGADA